MEISFKFRDNDTIIKFDLDKNSVLYGFNGSGKTRILRTLKEFSDIERSKNRLLDIFEKYNIEELQLNSQSLENLLDDKIDMTESNGEIFEEFISVNMVALEDFKAVIIDIIDTNRVIPFFPIPRFRVLLRRLKLLTNYSEENKDVDLSRELSVLLRNSSNTLNEVYHNLKNLEFHNFERLSQIEFALDIQAFLQRRFEDFKYDNTKRVTRRNVFTKAYKKSILHKLPRTTRYISTNLDELDKIVNKIEKDIMDAKAKVANQFVTKLLSNLEEVEVFVSDMKTRDIIEKLITVNKFIEKYMSGKLSLDGNHLSISKNNEKLLFSQLSSGEQRLLTLLLNATFTSEKLLLVDEPEISLSLNYQSQIMDDLVGLLGDKKIVIATHAPFIFKSCERLKFDLVEL